MKDKKIDRHSIDNGNRYELIPILIESVVVNPEGRSFVVLSDGDKKSACEINSYESGMLTFVAKDYHKNSHIQTIHQAFIKLLEIYKSDVESVEIERDMPRHNGRLLVVAVGIMLSSIGDSYSTIFYSV